MVRVLSCHFFASCGLVRDEPPGLAGTTFGSGPRPALGKRGNIFGNQGRSEFVKGRRRGRHSKKLQMQGARILRSEAYIEVRRNDER
jgi:hypothetical protein